MLSDLKENGGLSHMVVKIWPVVKITTAQILSRLQISSFLNISGDMRSITEAVLNAFLGLPDVSQ